MIARTLCVDDFPGAVTLCEGSSPEETRRHARAVAVPLGWFFSRSYRSSLGLVALCSTRVGVDIEVLDETVTADSVLTVDERRITATPADWCSWFSAKEALAKALGDARKYDARSLDSPALWRDDPHGRWRARQLRVPSGYVGWVVWESSDS